MRILDSARRHGITDADMLHAIQVPLHVLEQELDEATLFIGGGLDGALLEVIVADPEGEDPRIIHAMALRPKFFRYLPNRR